MVKTLCIHKMEQTEQTNGLHPPRYTSELNTLCWFRNATEPNVKKNPFSTGSKQKHMLQTA